MQTKTHRGDQLVINTAPARFIGGFAGRHKRSLMRRALAQAVRRFDVPTGTSRRRAERLECVRRAADVLSLVVVGCFLLAASIFAAAGTVRRR
jgi:hypothetical protein